MKPITVSKATLTERVQTNRDQHRAIFESAMDGFQAEAMRLLSNQMDRAKKGLRQNLYVSLQCPVDHTKDYDRVLGMLELEIGDTIELSEQDYSQYVDDNWSWKQQWSSSNASYTSMVSETPGYSEYADGD